MNAKNPPSHDLSFGGNESEWRARTRRDLVNVAVVVVVFAVLAAAENTPGGGKE